MHWGNDIQNPLLTGRNLEQNLSCGGILVKEHQVFPNFDLTSKFLRSSTNGYYMMWWNQGQNIRTIPHFPPIGRQDRQWQNSQYKINMSYSALLQRLLIYL